MIENIQNTNRLSSGFESVISGPVVGLDGLGARAIIGREKSSENFSVFVSLWFPCAGVAKLVDARDLKSRGQ
jgi:hypothetical protein